MFPLYTKSFGGKIWKNLHSVSPDNNFAPKIKKEPSNIFRREKVWIIPYNWKLSAKK